MKKIIAIRGKGNSGKTTSIKMAFEKFMIQNPSARRMREIIRISDIFVVVKINRVIIIFASAGDTEEVLRKLFNRISDIEWNFLICATKSVVKPKHLSEIRVIVYLHYLFGLIKSVVRIVRINKLRIKKLNKLRMKKQRLIFSKISNKKYGLANST